MSERVEQYSPEWCKPTSKPPPRCVVAGCMEPPVAEVHDECYGDALEIFRGICRPALRTRRSNDERFFCCAPHLETDPRMRQFEWQWLMFAGP